MKKITLLFCLFSLPIFAQTTVGDLITYDTRGAFLNACTNSDFLTFEDFETSSATPEPVICNSPISATTTNCLNLNEVQPGVVFESSNPDSENDMVLTPPSSGFSQNNAVGSFINADFTIINFTGDNPVTHVAFDLYAPAGGATVDVRVFGENGLIETLIEDVNFPNGNFTFVGFVAAEPITRIELEDLNTTDPSGPPNFELVAQLLFGTCGITNDDPQDAIALTVGAAFEDFPVTGSNEGATNTPLPDPSCADYQGGDVWYSADVLESGILIVETDASDSGDSITNSGLSLYEGQVGSLNEIECNDDGGNDSFSRVELTGRTPGETIFVRVWQAGNNVEGRFLVSAFDPTTLSVSDNTIEGLSFFPNPASDVITLTTEKALSGITIFNLLGQKVIDQQISNAATFKLDVSTLAEGAYLMQVVVDGAIGTYKIIKR